MTSCVLLKTSLCKGGSRVSIYLEGQNHYRANEYSPVRWWRVLIVRCDRWVGLRPVSSTTHLILSFLFHSFISALCPALLEPSITHCPLFPSPSSSYVSLPSITLSWLAPGGLIRSSLLNRAVTLDPLMSHQQGQWVSSSLRGRLWPHGPVVTGGCRAVLPSPKQPDPVLPSHHGHWLIGVSALCLSLKALRGGSEYLNRQTDSKLGLI